MSRAWLVTKAVGSPIRNPYTISVESLFVLQDPYVYDYMSKLSRQQAEVIQNHENANVRNIGQGEARHRKYKRLKLGGGQAYDRSND
jgi:hypothetical protein